MALIGNGVRLSASNPMRQHGAASVGSQTLERERAAGSMRTRFYGPATVSSVSRYASQPYGYRPPYTWLLAPKSGAMISYVAGEASATASGAMGVAAVGNIAGVGAATATGALIVSASGSIAGVGSATGAILAALAAEGSSAGSCSVTAAITALGWASGSAAGVATLSATRYAIGVLEGEVTPFTELSPANLAAAVWGALAADNNDAGTMGEKLNDAGGAADPWDDARALTVAKFLGLK